MKYLAIWVLCFIIIFVFTAITRSKKQIEDMEKDTIRFVFIWLPTMITAAIWAINILRS